MGDEVWTGSKRQREALRAKYGGLCAYCGCVLDKMHADHLEPVIRITNDPWGKRLPPEQRRMVNPELNTVANMMPACGPCNLHKSSYGLEEWREVLERAPAILARDKSIYRAALRFRVVTETRKPIVFHFEEARHG